ncbi:hypothetical protein BZA77DRAFT_14144 [Pyronema omphalodes]|nr:hypothetical protein BZA77DRAFT_14144 [Pyronema omphalodes]
MNNLLFRRAHCVFVAVESLLYLVSSRQLQAPVPALFFFDFILYFFYRFYPFSPLNFTAVSLFYFISLFKNFLYVLSCSVMVHVHDLHFFGFPSPPLYHPLFFLFFFSFCFFFFFCCELKKEKGLHWKPGVLLFFGIFVFTTTTLLTSFF